MFRLGEVGVQGVEWGECLSERMSGRASLALDRPASSGQPKDSCPPPATTLPQLIQFHTTRHPRRPSTPRESEQ